MNSTGKNSLVLAVLAIIAGIVVSGTLGFYFFEKPASPELTLWDSFWWAMVTVTTIGYGDIFPRTVGGRLIALVMMFAGIGTLSFFTAAVASYFIRGDGLQLLRLHQFKRHVIICGLGRKGLILVRAFRARGRNVVVIEEDENNDAIGIARDLGAVVLQGDAREAVLLGRAGIDRAQYLIVLCGDDGVNAEVAAHARELVQNRSALDALQCSVHIVDPELWRLLREWEISGGGAFRLQFFNVVDTAARALLDESPPFHTVTSEAPHILLVGAGRLGQSLLVHMARAWRDAASVPVSGPPPKLRFTVVDREVETAVQMLHHRHPELERVCEVRGLTLDLNDPEFHRARFLYDEDGRCHITKAYVCLPDDATSLSAALVLHGRLRHHEVPIVATMAEESGLAALLRTVSQVQHRFSTLHAVGLMERACQPELVIGGIPELIARALHDKYLEEQEMAGATVATNPLLVPWDELPEDARESNRAQALSIGEKLQAIGYDMAPLVDWDAAQHNFTAAEVEKMARMEHDRWYQERIALGWKVGPRDPERKTNPNLVPWDQLPANIQDFNRGVVRDIPASLAYAGFQIYRLSHRPPHEAAGTAATS
jgi:voltage-gated potassium channel Kch